MIHSVSSHYKLDYLYTLINLSLPMFFFFLFSPSHYNCLYFIFILMYFLCYLHCLFEYKACCHNNRILHLLLTEEINCMTNKYKNQGVFLWIKPHFVFYLYFVYFILKSTFFCQLRQFLSPHPGVANTGCHFVWPTHKWWPF